MTRPGSGEAEDEGEETPRSVGSSICAGAARVIQKSISSVLNIIIFICKSLEMKFNGPLISLF
jgi:hypothetical protein